MQVDKVKALTVGQLRAALADLPDSTEIVIDTNGWYDNVRAVILPATGEDTNDYLAVTLVPATTNDDASGNWDTFQYAYAQPADIIRPALWEA